MKPSLVIEPLNKKHNRSDFQCGVESLNHYLKSLANQDIKRRVTRLFIATRPDKPSTVLGYYTLSSISIALSSLPEVHARKLPKYSIPCALIGRLAVNAQYQRCGVGKMLLVDAIKRTLSISNEIGVYAVVVDAIDEKAADFYSSYGFEPLCREKNRLFLPLSSL